MINCTVFWSCIYCCHIKIYLLSYHVNIIFFLFFCWIICFLNFSDIGNNFLISIHFLIILIHIGPVYLSYLFYLFSTYFLFWWHLYVSWFLFFRTSFLNVPDVLSFFLLTPILSVHRILCSQKNGTPDPVYRW